MAVGLGVNDFIACCGSTKFAEQMVADGPFDTYDKAVVAAKNIWFNKVCLFFCVFMYNLLDRILILMDIVTTG